MHLRPCASSCVWWVSAMTGSWLKDFFPSGFDKRSRWGFCEVCFQPPVPSSSPATLGPHIPFAFSHSIHRSQLCTAFLQFHQSAWSFFYGGGKKGKKKQWISRGCVFLEMHGLKSPGIIHNATINSGLIIGAICNIGGRPAPSRRRL